MASLLMDAMAPSSPSTDPVVVAVMARVTFIKAAMMRLVGHQLTAQREIQTNPHGSGWRAF